MKLKNVRVKCFRNIVGSGDVNVEENITALVGKNESGKTAFLEALYLLNPDRPNRGFDVHDHYPAWKEKLDRRRKDLSEVTPIWTEFELEDEELSQIQTQIGPDALSSPVVRVSRKYSGELVYAFDINETSVLECLTSDFDEVEFPNLVADASTFADLRGAIDTLQDSSDDGPDDEVDGLAEILKELKLRIEQMLGGEADLRAAVQAQLSALLPKFFYFSDYSTLPNEVEIKSLLKADPETLEDDELTALSLLRLAGTDDDYLVNPDYEKRRRELENIANLITGDILQYWTQNPSLRAVFDITLEEKKKKKNRTAVVDKLKIRVRDQRHMLSLPFQERSTGFKWFFSFMAAFYQYEETDEPLIILLDEPGLGLHARAQKDFLQFIEDRLGASRQVFYTTHSPFMVQPDSLERVRIVEDKGVAPFDQPDAEEGSKVTAEVLTIDSDTLFPLQGALGYDIAQHLLIAPHNLLVEGTSDFTYMVTISDYLTEQGRVGLHEEWSLIPVGGADLIPTFIALLGHHLDVTVVVDSQKGGHQKLSRLAHKGYLKESRLIPIGSIIDEHDADLEDLFAIDDYLALFNEAFGKSVAADDLQGTDTIVQQLARHEGVDSFNHGLPADFFLRNRDELLPKLSETTLENFEELFRSINATMES